MAPFFRSLLFRELSETIDFVLEEVSMGKSRRSEGKITENQVKEKLLKVSRDDVFFLWSEKVIKKQ